MTLSKMEIIQWETSRNLDSWMEMVDFVCSRIFLVNMCNHEHRSPRWLFSWHEFVIGDDMNNILSWIKDTVFLGNKSMLNLILKQHISLFRTTYGSTLLQNFIFFPLYDTYCNYNFFKSMNLIFYSWQVLYVCKFFFLDVKISQL